MERTRRAEELFQQATELPREAREEFLARVCSGDPALSQEVGSLFDALEAELSFLEKTADERRSLGSGRGLRLGPYELVEEIGSGGMGTVWRARRVDGAYDKEVAIKLIQRVGATADEREELRRRFLEERQILADLDHPYIARLLDGGSAADGSPYLVMELVEGLAIDEYCDERALSARQRQELFLEVCRAVQYAHGKFVAHRDLKPSNVLVSEGEGGEPVPKLLDFGIARLLQERDARRPADLTVASPRLTPAYASPEQLCGERVTAATDVYSLGTLLYELLTGRLPHDLEGRAPLDALRAVCEEPPIPLAQVDRRLAGDLDTIVQKSLEKDPSRRYATALELAEDLERHLDGRPIRARPTTRLYRLRKLVGRHTLPFALASAIVCLLIGASIWVSVLYWRAKRSEALAEERRGRAEEARKSADLRTLQAEKTAALFVEIFSSPDPFRRTRGRETTVVEALDSGLPRVIDELGDQPLVLAEIRRMAGSTYHGLGAYEHAERELRAALPSFEQHGDPDGEEARLVRYALAGLLLDSGEIKEAERLLAPLLSSAPGPELSPAELLGSRNAALYYLEIGDYARARARLEHVVAEDVRQKGDHDLKSLEDKAFLAQVLIGQSEFHAAEALLRSVIDAQAAVLGEEHPSTLEARSRLADVYTRTSRPVEAIALLEPCLESLEGLLGREHRVVLNAVTVLATALSLAGESELAEARYRDLLQSQIELLGEDHRDVARTRHDLASHLFTTGRIEEAQELYESVLAARREDGGLGQTDALPTVLDYSIMLAEGGDLDAACRLLGECASQMRASAAESREATKIVRLHGLRLAQVGRPEEAQSELLALREKLEGSSTSWSRAELAETLSALAIVADRRQDPSAAEEYRSLAQQAARQ